MYKTYTLQRAKRQAAVDELEKKRKAQTDQQALIDADEAKRLRAEAIKKTPEWSQMLALTKDESFLQALEALYLLEPKYVQQKVGRKRVKQGVISDLIDGNKFKDVLSEPYVLDFNEVFTINEKPLDYQMRFGVQTSSGVITVGWERVKDKYDASHGSYKVDDSVWFDIFHLEGDTEYSYLVSSGTSYGIHGGTPDTYEERIAHKGLVVACDHGILSVKDFYDYIAELVVGRK